ncbi:MAG: putative addiction module component [Candidatus Scalindua rubra]|uniref:Putative addiction module component n=1 Tax=Candidatus Scalindua rubra TaxID=1872076 RepID=A0A1E3X6K2_9BACT|nr:MAG: putative addiction module component [Candidatus Scalindua rubra]
MSMKPEQLVKEILQLPIQQRAFLAEKLLESLDFTQDFQLTKEWSEEIKRRCEEIDKGLVELIPAEDVFEKAYKQLG